MFRFLGVVSKASLGLASVPLEQHKSGNLKKKRKLDLLGKTLEINPARNRVPKKIYQTVFSQNKSRKIL